MSGSVYQTTKRSHVGTSWYALDVNEYVTAFLRTLQDRNLKAVSETAIGSMLINTYVAFTLGEGLEPQASPETSVTGWSEEQRSNFISQAESFFRRYAGSKRIDHYGKLNFYQLQNIALRNCLVDGDSLLHRSYRNARHDFEPYIQVLSGRWVRNPNNEIDSKELIGGVAFDKVGREVGYWIAETSNDLVDNFDSHFVSKFNSNSGFEEFNLVRLDLHEANQVRGVPVLSPVLEDIFDLETFKAAYKAKAATQALFTGVITSEKDTPAPVVSTVETLKNLSVPSKEEMIEAAKAGQVNDVSLGSGNIIQLNPGEKFDMAESKVPATDFKSFVESELSHICAGVGNGGMAYEMVLQKYNNNYSASRATIAGQEKKFKNLRSIFSTQFCDPIWEQVIDWGIRKGYIEAPGYLEGDWMFRKSVLACTWIGPSPINIDPKKEVEAHIMAVNAGLETKEDAVREMYGKDYEETVERRIHEKELEENAGLSEDLNPDITPSEQEEDGNNDEQQ